MTTNLSIQGVEYDLEDATRNTQLNILVHMQKRIGVTLKQVILGIQMFADDFRAAQTRRDNGDADAPDDFEVMLDIFSDEEKVDRLRGLVWLCRTQAGERAPDGGFLTLDSANDGIGYADLAFVNPDEDDEGKEGAGDATPADDPSSSTTSSRTYTTTS